MNKNIFCSPTKGKMKLPKVAKEIADFINQDTSAKYRLIVGTDSSGEKRADFVTAIVVHRVGRGGRYFWKKINGNKIYHILRDRIYQEVSISLQTSQDLLDQLKHSLKMDCQADYDFQIHIDVGRKGPTREMIKEVIGMVRGNGFKAKIKPESYGASSIADKYT
ncbi:MAG: ribonuclease H-like YkuK family protein [Patescibacteria group bacterium]|nr:ribonuclease H-like YkuK family protein [Patescibacteria group bacterium]